MIVSQQRTAPGRLDGNRHNTELATPQRRQHGRNSLESAYAELLHSISLSCATAGALQSLEQDRGSSPPAARCALLPPAPTCYPVVIGHLMDEPALHDLADALREYYELQGIARGLTEIFDSGSFDRGPLVGYEAVTTAWQDVVAMALSVLAEFDRTLPNSPNASRARELCRVVERIRIGDRVEYSDCWQPQLRDIGERRGLTRANVRTYVLVERGMALLRLLVNNVSRRGLGLEGVSDVAPGEQMRVLWKPGASILARVVWADAHRFGLEIAEEAAFADEFIRSLIEA